MESVVILEKNEIGEQLSKLFNRDIKTIGKHINNILNEELDNSTVAKFTTVQKEVYRKLRVI